MQKICKHDVPLGPFQGFSLELPEGAQILHVGNQREQSYFWVQQEVDSPGPKVIREFLCIATGRPLPDLVSGLNYLGTVHFLDSREIYLYFEVW